MGAVSQGTELAPAGPPCWDCLWDIYSAGGDRQGQKNQSLSVQPDAAFHVHHLFPASNPAREGLCPSTHEKLRVGKGQALVQGHSWWGVIAEVVRSQPALKEPCVATKSPGSWASSATCLLWLWAPEPWFPPLCRERFGGKVLWGVSNPMNSFLSVPSVSGRAHVTWSMPQKERASVLSLSQNLLPARGFTFIMSRGP